MSVSPVTPAACYASSSPSYREFIWSSWAPATAKQVDTKQNDRGFQGSFVKFAYLEASNSHYWNCNFPISPYVGWLVGRSFGRSVIRSVGWSVGHSVGCFVGRSSVWHNFLKGGSLQFHAPNGVLVAFTSRCQPKQTHNKKLSDLIFIMRIMKECPWIDWYILWYIKGVPQKRLHPAYQNILSLSINLT